MYVQSVQLTFNYEEDAYYLSHEAEEHIKSTENNESVFKLSLDEVYVFPRLIRAETQFPLQERWSNPSVNKRRQIAPS